jgi:thioesterase domain-containing protein
LVGASFGGSLAFEMAQQLVARGEDVSLLAVLDAGARVHKSGSTRRPGQSLADFARNLPWWIRYDLLEASFEQIVRRIRIQARSLAKRLRQRDELPFWGPALEEIWDLDAFPEPTREVLARHFEAWKVYEPRPYRGRVTVFRARARPLFRPGARPDLGWGSVALGGAEVVVVPGNHNTIMREPHVRVLAQHLTSRLAAAVWTTG